MGSDVASERRVKSGRVTAAMVAERAGVSTATVSLVVSGKAQGRVSPKNAEKVLAAVAELGYFVDSAASSLSKGYSPLVLLIATDVANPFYAELITAARQALGPSYELLLSVSDPGGRTDPDALRRLLALRPAGLLLDAPDERLLTALPDRAPAVLLDAPEVGTDLPAVNLDVAHGARQLAEHLAAAGHRRVAYLDSTVEASTFRVRREAFVRSAAELGLAAGPPLEARSLTDIGSAADAFRAAWPLWSAEGVTAVACATDTHAYGLMHGARATDVRIPQDLAVAGFDDLPYSRSSNPSLTSVHLPAGPLGRRAGEQLLALIEGRPLEQRQIVLDSYLVARESTAARAAGGKVTAWS